MGVGFTQSDDNHTHKDRLLEHDDVQIRFAKIYEIQPFLLGVSIIDDYTHGVCLF